MNKLLKDAIADAKAVRETALANAKLALEEAFAPQMNKIFSEKIKMEMSNDPEETEEGTYMEDEMAPENEMMDPKNRMKELAGLDDDDDEDDDLFGDKFKSPELPDDEDEDARDAAMGDMDDMGDTDDDEDTGYGDDQFGEGIDEDLEEIIRQLEEGDDEDLPEPPEEKLPVMEDLDEEINLDEVIAALREDDEFEGGEQPMQESIESFQALMNIIGSVPGDVLDVARELYNEIPAGTIGQGEDALSMKAVASIALAALGTGLGLNKIRQKIKAAAQGGNKLADKVDGFLDGITSARQTESYSMEDESKMEELEEAYSVIEHLREKINEVNLLNAKLLYVNKLFKKHNLSEGEKVRVVETFDRAVTVRETKIIYTTLSESLSTRATKKTKVMTEGFASSPVKKTQILTESNSIVSRFQKLAGLTNED